MAPDNAPVESGSASKIRLEAAAEDADAAPAKRTRHASKMPPPSFSNASEMVTFLVGKKGEEETFKVHKEFACYYSPVLYAAFNSDFEEGQTQTYRLADTGPGAFRLLVRWLYSQTFIAPPTGDSNKKQELEKLEDLDLIQLWVVADRLLIRPLQNCAMKTLSQLWNWNIGRDPSLEWMPYAYEHTVAGSPLRKLAVDLCLWGFPGEGIVEDDEENQEKFRQNLPHELLFDIFKGTSKARGFDNRAPKGARMAECKYIVDENHNLVGPGDDEPFFSGQVFSVSRTMTNYLVPEDD